MESQRQPACAAHIISLAHCRAERRPPQHATPYGVPCGICHQCSLGGLRATPGRCVLAHCATLRAECGCAERHSSVCVDAPTLAAAHRREPIAHRSNASPDGSLRRSARRCATSASSFKRRCRQRGSFSSPSPPPHVAPWLHEPREHRRLRALQAVVAEGFRSKLCRGRAVSKLAVQCLALGSTGVACCLQAPTPSHTT